MSFHIVIMLYFMYIWKKKTEVHKKKQKKKKIKVNEPRYKQCGVTPHFPQTKK